MAEGLGAFLASNEVFRVVDAYAKMIAYGKSEAVKRQARDLLFLLYYETEGAVQGQVAKRVDVWIGFFGDKLMVEPKMTLEEMKTAWDPDIPF